MFACRGNLSVLACLALTGLVPSGGEGAAPPNRARTDRYGDPLPSGAVARLGTVRFRAPGAMNNVVFSPDGRLLASTGSSVGEKWALRVWDRNTGRRVR